MTKDELSKLSHEIKDISNHFEDKPWTENIKLLKKDFNINSIKTPNNYLTTIDELEELVRETRLLFLHSVLNIAYKESGKLQNFDSPYQQENMEFVGVMKKEGSFQLLDEDGNYHELFTSIDFVTFIDEQYWRLYENN